MKHYSKLFHTQLLLKLVLYSAVGWVCLFVDPTVVEAKRLTGFISKTINLTHGTYRYRVYVPTQWSPAKKWPVILFLHGAGERGSDGQLQTMVGLGPYMRKHPHTIPAIVVFPQAQQGSWWSDPAMEELALLTLQSSLKEYHGDQTRVYLTGVSMGGYGTWHLASMYPEMFAAIVPVCGRTHPPSGVERNPQSIAALYSNDIVNKTAFRVKDTPVWLFHGAKDEVVPVQESRKMVKAFQRLGGSVVYTEYSDVGHESWDEAYAETDLFSWLLSHKLS